MSSQWLPPVPTGEPTQPPPAASWAPPQVPGPGDRSGPPPRDTRSTIKRLTGPLIMVGLLLAKFGKAAILVLPKAKILTTSGSMLVSIGAYSLIWGWQFALGFVLLLLIHELGHVIQLRREGIEASAPMFIPFLGAAVMAKSLGDNATAEARVGLAGPVLGTAAALALIPLAEALDSDFWRALAFIGLFLNLFNLLPVVPLDGGRAMAALSPWMWFVGLFAMVGLAFAFPNPIIILIALFAAWETYRRWKARKEGGEAARAFYRVAPRHRLVIGLVYIGLVAVCVLGMDFTFVERDFDDV